MFKRHKICVKGYFRFDDRSIFIASARSFFTPLNLSSQRIDESDAKAFPSILRFSSFLDIPKLKLTIAGKTSKMLNQIEIKSDDEVKLSCVVKAVPIAYSINWKRNVRNSRSTKFWITLHLRCETFLLDYPI